MKSKDTKYREAIDRNLATASKNPYQYTNMPIPVIRGSLGIRNNDTSFDDQIMKLVSLGKPKQEVI